ncbi:MAG: metallophosphoesterase, partial [Phycisphaerales bacterium]
MLKANYLKTVLLIVLVVGIVSNLAGAQPFRFTASADNRPYDAANLARWEWLLDEMDRLFVDDEGVFHIMPGDFDSPEITDDTLKTQFGPETIWYPVVGNHEAETPADMTWIRGAYGSLPYIVNSGPPGCETTTYSWDYGNAHFIAINEYYDGTSDVGTDGDVVDALYNWLAADLAANTQPVVFVIGHEPAYPQGAHTEDSLNKYPTNRDRFWKLLNDEKVIAYLCGHTHYYSALQQAQTGDYPCDAFTWQIDCGNAGNPRELEQTFVDVAVTETDVTFQVFQGLKDADYQMTDFWIVDIPTPIEEAHNPSPADGATEVAIDGVLEWAAGAGAESHNVYFGTTNPPPFVQNQAGTIYDPPGTMDYETTYYWRIDELGSDGTV